VFLAADAYAVDCADDPAFPENPNGGSGAMAANCNGSGGAPYSTVTCDFPAASVGGAPASTAIDVTQVVINDPPGSSWLHTFGTDGDGETFCVIVELDQSASTWTINNFGTGKADDMDFDHSHSLGVYTLASWDETWTTIEMSVDAGSGGDTITLPITNVGHECTVDAGPGDDTVYGSPLADVIHGGDNVDTIYGYGGNDVLNGDAHGDFIYGGDDDDEIDGGTHGDTIEGQGGADTIFGGRGGDTIDGGDEDDRIDGGPGLDTLLGKGGNDTICAGDSAVVNYLNGGNGEDVLWGGDSAGAAGPSTLEGEAPFSLPGDLCGGTSGTRLTCDTPFGAVPGFCL